MQAAIATAPAEMHPVMNAILAHWYWHYFQQNRWRFVQRTATGEAPGNDIQTWDLPRIFAEIDKTFDKALAAEKELKATPVEQYDILLDEGHHPGPVPADAVRLPRVRRAQLLRLRRAGRREAAGRLRAARRLARSSARSTSS